ncbi:MAG: hypothetical protein DCC55_02930 [Chloroflexi bacterium]|nr:MAG: hypothetical protein DCC55_02930 [Chloroflexota bacterium]
MQIAPFEPARAGKALFQLYTAYINELSAFTRQYGAVWDAPRPWWLGDPDSLVHVARDGQHLAGFVINGWRSRVDPDTDSEILELYVAPPFRRSGCGRQLAHMGISLLSGRAGLQVYLDNTPAQRFWSTVLSGAGIVYRTYGAIDGLAPVVKFRFSLDV